jgi:hypothetical protein
VSHVLFVCVRNSGRSVMAERLFRRVAGDRHEARSAGSNPGSAPLQGFSRRCRRSGSTRRITSRTSSTPTTSPGATSPSPRAARRSARLHRAFGASVGSSRIPRTVRSSRSSRSATRSRSTSSSSSKNSTRRPDSPSWSSWSAVRRHLQMSDPLSTRWSIQAVRVEPSRGLG